MAQYRVQIAHHISAAPDAKDTVVNTFYLDTDLVLPGDEDNDQLVQDAVDVFDLAFTAPAPYDRITGRMYNMADPKPREPVATFTKTIGSGGAAGPREVALCLSYFADRNLPRKRGRMYIGPWTAAGMGDRPTLAQRQVGQGIAEGISGLGGVNVQWVQYSPTTNTFSNVTDYFIDDEWDTVRSRGQRSTTRLTGTVSG